MERTLATHRPVERQISCPTSDEAAPGLAAQAKLSVAQLRGGAPVTAEAQRGLRTACLHCPGMRPDAQKVSRSWNRSLNNCGVGSIFTGVGPAFAWKPQMR